MGWFDIQLQTRRDDFVQKNREFEEDKASLKADFVNFAAASDSIESGAKFLLATGVGSIALSIFRGELSSYIVGLPVACIAGVGIVKLSTAQSQLIQQLSPRVEALQKKYGTKFVTDVKDEVDRNRIRV